MERTAPSLIFKLRAIDWIFWCFKGLTDAFVGEMSLKEKPVLAINPGSMANPPKVTAGLAPRRPFFGRNGLRGLGGPLHGVLR